MKNTTNIKPTINKFCKSKELSIETIVSFINFTVYVIGKIGFRNLNPLVTVSIGNVPPDAASCNTNIISATNLPISTKFIIKNSIIANKQFETNTITK